MVVQRGGQALLFGRGGRTHLPHHVHRVDPRGRRQGQQMLRHAKRGRHQVVRVHQSVQEADVVEALGGETKPERHLHRDRVRHVGDVAMVVAAQQPALCLRHLEHGFRHRHAQIGALDQHEAAAHGKAVDGGDHRLLQRAVHERIADRDPRAARHAGGQRLLHVLAGAEAAAGAGEDRNLELLVVTKLGPGLGEFLAHLGVERVQPLGAVHAHDQNLSVALRFDDSHAMPRFEK